MSDRQIELQRTRAMKIASDFFTEAPGIPTKFHLIGGNANVENMIKLHGGTIVPSIETADVVLVPKALATDARQVISLQRKNFQAILRAEWVYQCHEKNEYIDYLPYEFLAQSLQVGTSAKTAMEGGNDGQHAEQPQAMEARSSRAANTPVSTPRKVIARGPYTAEENEAIAQQMSQFSPKYKPLLHIFRPHQKKHSHRSVKGYLKYYNNNARSLEKRAAEIRAQRAADQQRDRTVSEMGSSPGAANDQVNQPLKEENIDGNQPEGSRRQPPRGAARSVLSHVLNPQASGSGRGASYAQIEQDNDTDFIYISDSESEL